MQRNALVKIRAKGNAQLTHKVITKENRKLKRRAAISAFGDIAATAMPNVVKYKGNMMPNDKYV
jgi:hypothetical protein